MQTDYDTIIIGAGPAGATAAILLAQAGWSVVVLEKQCYPRRKVCGECIAASNLPLLEALGIGDALAALGGPRLRRVALWCGRQAISAPLPAASAGGHPWGLALGREHLDTLLLQRARALGACVLQPCSAQSLGRSFGDLRCDAIGADGETLTLRAPVVIGAYGSWQPLPADRVSRQRSRRAADLLAFKANFRDVRLDDGLLPVLSFAGGYGGMVVAGHGVTTVACCLRADRLQACRAACRGASAGAAVEAYLRRACTPLGEALQPAAPAGSWLAAGPIRPGVRLRPGRGGAFLIGNAAGEAHPIIGEGISMAIQSAWLLCALLLRQPDVLLRTPRAERLQHGIHQRYAALWRARFAGRVHLAACFAHLAMRPRAMAPLLPLLRRAPALLTHSARWSGKVRCAAGGA
jgi:2-polyprenyl-6-methoxyphenol hydroxylase-like FAD-dependent oxidoreductase